MVADRSFRGIVVAGRGLAVPSMSKERVLRAVRSLTDIGILPGTLNVRLTRPFDASLKSYVTEEELGGSVWRDHVPDRKGVKYGEVVIAGRFRGIIFQGDEPEYPSDQAEIMSDHLLREALNLKDGDSIEFTLVGNPTRRTAAKSF